MWDIGTYCRINHINSKSACHLTGIMPSHAIGQKIDAQAIISTDVIFVILADKAGVGGVGGGHDFECSNKKSDTPAAQMFSSA
jgi:hypothetical protein